MTANPLEEILRAERSVAEAISEAKEEATAALVQARRRADQLVADARSRGQANAERRYEEGIARARNEGELIHATADDKIAALRRRTESHLSAAVSLVLKTVLPVVEED